MAAPNLLTVTSITGKTAYLGLSTVTGNVLLNAAASNTVYKINDISICNYSGSAVSANVIINRAGGPYYIAGTISVPAYSTLVVLAKDTTIYLEEGDTIQANCSANTSTHIVASYELMS